MNSRLTVSTECPTCGAPLDFTEGSHAIQCGHCRSRLLVTGRKQLLSYFISPKLDVHRAVAKALVAQREEGGECRVIEPRLYFVPYYRMTGHDFIWEQAAPKPQVEPLDPAAFSTDAREIDFEGTVRTAFNLFDAFWEAGKRFCGGEDDLLSEEKEMQGAAVPVERRHPLVEPPRNEPEPVLEEEMVFRDRYVEKNFIACDLKGWGPYSLGVRPTVLRLELFQKEVMQAQGRIVGVTVSPEEAFRQGMKGAEPVLYRQVLDTVLSLIYFPFWVIQVQKKGEERLILLDAVSEQVIHLNAPIAFLESLDRPAIDDAATIGFRPLTCPNCGWDLPFTPEEILFFCATCEKGWQLRGSDLLEIGYEVVALSDQAKPVRYLPMWVLQAEVEQNASFRFFVPAFRYRRLKLLGDLARHLSKIQPTYALSTNSFKAAQGGCYDQEDAVLFAQFTWAGLQGRKGITDLNEKPLLIRHATLTWFPFHIEGNGLRDPFTGMELPQNLFA